MVLAGLALIAATPQEVVPELEAGGYYIEDGSTASEQVVSDAVFDGRADGGRLHIVVLAEEPPGGATTFSDSVLDRLGGGYVVTVAPETVGYAGDETFWTKTEMDTAIEVSLDGGSDDEVVQLFIAGLVGGPVGSGGDTPGEGASSSGGIPIMWILVIGGIAALIWYFLSKRQRAQRVAGRMEEVRRLAREKLAEVANDILEMEDEVAVSDNREVEEHYQRASVMYSQAMEDNAAASTVAQMMEVSEELDIAIWELDAAEALLDGKPKPPKPEPKRDTVPTPPPVEDRVLSPRDRPDTDGFDRRPQRQSSGTEDLMSMLMAMLAMGGLRSGRGGGFGGGLGGGFGGGLGGGSGGGGRGPISRGGGRIRGGGRRRG